MRVGVAKFEAAAFDGFEKEGFYVIVITFTT